MSVTLLMHEIQGLGNLCYDSLCFMFWDSRSGYVALKVTVAQVFHGDVEKISVVKPSVTLNEMLLILL